MDEWLIAVALYTANDGEEKEIAELTQSTSAISASNLGIKRLR